MWVAASKRQDADRWQLAHGAQAAQLPAVPSLCMHTIAPTSCSKACLLLAARLRRGKRGRPAGRASRRCCVQRIRACVSLLLREWANGPCKPPTYLSA